MKLKKLVLNILCFILIIIILIISFFNNKLIFNVIDDTLYIWIKIVFPSLFFYLIITDLILNTNFIKYFSYVFIIFKKIINPKYLTVFLISLFTGNHASTNLINNLYLNKEISKKEAIYLINTCSMTSSFFIYNYLGIILNHNLAINFLIIHIISNLGLLIVLKPKCFLRNNYQINNNKKSLLAIIEKNINILFIIGGIMIFFNVIQGILLNYNFKYLPYFLELVTGLKSQSNLYFKLFLLGFGGISIHIQNYQIAKEFMNYKKYFIIKIINGINHILLFFILF